MASLMVWWQSFDVNRLSAFRRIPRQITAAAIAFALSLTLVSGTASAAGLDRAKAVVSELGTDAVNTVSDESLDYTGRADAFTKILDKGFDIERIARFVLGKHWRTAKPEEQTRYLELFREFVIQTYVRRFNEYSGEMLDVTAANEDGRFTMVKSVIRRPKATDVRVNWRMMETGGDYKVVDVEVEGISMGITQRADFDSIIQRGDGTLTTLNDALAQKLGQ